MVVNKRDRADRSTGRRIALAAVLMAMSSVLLAASASADSPTVHFADTTVLTLRNANATVVIDNDTDVSYAVSVSLSLFNADGSPSKAFDVATHASSLGPGNSRAFLIKPAAGTTPASAKGTVSFLATAGSSRLRGSLPVSVSPADSLVPVVKTLSMVSVRRWPFGGGSERISVYLPLQEGETCPVPLATVPATVVLSNGSRTAQLEGRCVMAGTSARIVFDGSKLGPPGNYTGTLTIGSTEVALMVQRTTSVVWALVILLIGFIVALLWHSWTAAGPVRQCRQRLAKLAGGATDAQTSFENMTAGQPYRMYQFRDGVLRRIGTLETQLVDVRPRWMRHWYAAVVPSPKDAQDAAVVNVTKSMDTLDDLIRAWPGLAGDFGKLQNKLDGVTAAETSGTPLKDFAPKLVAHADQLLHPPEETEQALDDRAAAALVAEVPATIDALGLPLVLEEIGTRLADVKPPPNSEADFAVWNRANQLYRQARTELAQAASASEVEAAGLADVVQTARRLVLQLAPVSPAVTGQTFVPGALGLGSVVSVLQSVKAPRRRMASSVSSSRAVGLFWVLLAFAIAVWSGLTSLYLDKAWGTARDDFAMFVWAIGVCTVVPVLLSSLEDFGAGPIPLKGVDGDGDKPAPVK
jgi:hypothetical protein